MLSVAELSALSAGATNLEPTRGFSCLAHVHTSSFGQNVFQEQGFPATADLDANRARLFQPNEIQGLNSLVSSVHSFLRGSRMPNMEYRCNVDENNKATELPLLRLGGTAQQNPHMRAFWASTISFFLAFLGC